MAKKAPASTFNLQDTSGRHPQIYVYTQPQYASNPSWTRLDGTTGQGILKVGYTSKKDVNDRLESIRRGGVLGPFGRPILNLLKTMPAINAVNQPFMDHSVHAQLKDNGVVRMEGEWFQAHLSEVEAAHAQVVAKPLTDFPPQSYSLRAEQQAAIDQTSAYFLAQADRNAQTGHWLAPHFLWNAKMRFGKTFTTYKLMEKMSWTRLLVLSFKPAVAHSWESDLRSHIDFKDWQYVDKETDITKLDPNKPQVWFCSFQQLLHPNASSDNKVFLDACRAICWDNIALDEYHFGSWNDRSRASYLGSTTTNSASPAAEAATPATAPVNSPQDAAQPIPDDVPLQEQDSDELDAVSDSENVQTLLQADTSLRAKYYLYLSGTPFRALETGEFSEDCIFNWTYSDEQRAKAQWVIDHPDAKKNPNPYASLPSMAILAYSIPDSLAQVALDAKTSELSLNQFFAVDKTKDGVPTFKFEAQVKQWLDFIQNNYTAPSSKEKGSSPPVFPFEKKVDREACRHTLWLMSGVDQCKAMAALLNKHPGFAKSKDHGYDVIVAAGSDSGSGAEALIPVKKKMANPFATKTITLSCGKLTTGVTVPPWGAIFMLSDLTSLETYFQAAFRVQSPWIMPGTPGMDPDHIFKERCYVLDFAPQRALNVLHELAWQGLSSKSDSVTHALDDLLEMLPTALVGMELTPIDARRLMDQVFTHTNAAQLRYGFKNKNLLQLTSTHIANLDASSLSSIRQILAAKASGKAKAIDLDGNSVDPKKKQSSKNPTDSETSDGDAETTPKPPENNADLREKLEHVVLRLPVYFYLTDQRDQTVFNSFADSQWQQVFKTTTSLDSKTFKACADAEILAMDPLNRLAIQFRTYDGAGLRYLDGDQPYPFAQHGAMNVAISVSNAAAYR